MCLLTGVRRRHVSRRTFKLPMCRVGGRHVALGRKNSQKSAVHGEVDGMIAQRVPKFAFQCGILAQCEPDVEKQIGHAVLLQDGVPLSEPDELARRFRQEILPLLQEYCYDEYEALADLLGDQIVDRETQSLRSEILNDNDRLLSELESEFSKESITSQTEGA